MNLSTQPNHSWFCLIQTLDSILAFSFPYLPILVPLKIFYLLLENISNLQLHSNLSFLFLLQLRFLHTFQKVNNPVVIWINMINFYLIYIKLTNVNVMKIPNLTTYWLYCNNMFSIMYKPAVIINVNFLIIFMLNLVSFQTENLLAWFMSFDRLKFNRPDSNSIYQLVRNVKMLLALTL